MRTEQLWFNPGKVSRAERLFSKLFIDLGLSNSGMSADTTSFLSWALVALSLSDLDFLTVLCLCHLFWINATCFTQCYLKRILKILLGRK